MSPFILNIQKALLVVVRGLGEKMGNAGLMGHWVSFRVKKTFWNYRVVMVCVTL